MHRPIQKKRIHLQQASVVAAVLILAGLSFGFVDSLTGRISFKPDRHRLLFSELARQTSLATGTPTIVKEDDETLAAFEREYNRRNQKLGLAAGQVTAPDNSVLQFSYVPGMMEKIGSGLIEIPGSKLVKENTRPMIWEDEPGTHPLVVWIYSVRENLLACFVYQLLTPDHPLSIRPPYPDPRVIQSLDLSDTVSVHGEVPNVKVFPEHAYLLPLGDLKLENLNRGATDVPNLFVFLHGLPMVMSPAREERNQPVLPTAEDTIALLRNQAARPFVLTRRFFRFGVLPLGLVLLVVGFWRMQTLHRKYNSQVDELLPSFLPRNRLGFIAFQTADLESQMKAAQTEVRALQERALAAELEKVELHTLKEELQRYLANSQLNDDEIVRINGALATQSLPEFRSLAVGFRLKLERERQIVRERERELQWLESEFESIPPLKRHNEARDAWDLYQQALTLDDPRLRLHALKDARKKLPKDLIAGSG